MCRLHRLPPTSRGVADTCIDTCIDTDSDRDSDSDSATGSDTSSDTSSDTDTGAEQCHGDAAARHFQHRNSASFS